jgi:hypothetical protein
MFPVRYGKSISPPNNFQSPSEGNMSLNKYLITPIIKRLSSLYVTTKQVDEWARNWEFFFILGFGRSGTAFMADLLNRVTNAYVFHEPVLEDFYAHARAHYNPKDTDRYIQGFRKKEIFTRMRHIPSGIYGEVNSTIRCHAGAIQRAFPKAVLIHLVRDGRDVVRSTFGRRAMTIQNPFSLSIRPDASDPWRDHWHDMDRFARICWFWQEENRRLRTSIGRTVQFEKILSSYEYFSREILEPCGIHIAEDVWKAAIAIPQNISRGFSMPKWEQWTSEQQSNFREICGKEMLACGYDF